jgi:hypothetical protein
MSDSNPIALPERTSLIVYDADIFNCSRQPQIPALAHSPGALGTEKRPPSARPFGLPPAEFCQLSWNARALRDPVVRKPQA